MQARSFLRGFALVSAIALASVLVPSSTMAQTEPDQVRTVLEERFEVLVLRSGVVLRALEGQGPPRVVELDEDGVAVDGVLVGEDELRARLGDELADAILAAAALGGPALEAAAAAPGAEDEASSDEVVVPDPEEIEAAEEAVETEADRGDRDDRARKRFRRDTQIVIGSSLTIEEDEVSDDVMVVGGPLRIHGIVEGDAVAFGAPVTVTGHVEGDVAAFGGPVYLEETARVDGDVVAVGGVVKRDPGAYIGGEIEDVPFAPNLRFGRWGGWSPEIDTDFGFAPWTQWMRVGWKVFWVLVVTLFAFLAILVARRPVERMERRITNEPWKCGLVGLAGQLLALPVGILVTVVLAISIIGIPVLLLLPFLIIGIAVAAFFGFVAVARKLGQWIEGRFGRKLESPYVEVLVGLGVIYLLSLVGRLLDVGPFGLRLIAGMFLLGGLLIWYAAVTVGFGASILTRFGTADNWQRGQLPPVPSVPPVPGPGAEHALAEEEYEAGVEEAADEWPEEPGPDERR